MHRTMHMQGELGNRGVFTASRKVRTPKSGITVNDRPGVGGCKPACRRGLGPQRRVCNGGTLKRVLRHGVPVVQKALAS